MPKKTDRIEKVKLILCNCHNNGEDIEFFKHKPSYKRDGKDIIGCAYRIWFIKWNSEMNPEKRAELEKTE